MKKMKKATDPKHFNSKYYKKTEPLETCIIDTENIDHKLMEQIAAEWWNNWTQSDFLEKLVQDFYYKTVEIKNLISTKHHSILLKQSIIKKPKLELLKGDKNETLGQKREKVIKKAYYEVMKYIKNRDKVYSTFAFTTIMMYCIPNFFKPWLREIEIDKRKNIKGKLEIEILNFLFNKNNLLVQKIYNHFENEFEATIKGIITRMKKKGCLREISFNNKLFYGVSKNVKHDSAGYYLE